MWHSTSEKLLLREVMQSVEDVGNTPVSVFPEQIENLIIDNFLRCILRVVDDAIRRLTRRQQRKCLPTRRFVSSKAAYKKELRELSDELAVYREISSIIATILEASSGPQADNSALISEATRCCKMIKGTSCIVEPLLIGLIDILALKANLYNNGKTLSLPTLPSLMDIPLSRVHHRRDGGLRSISIDQANKVDFCPLQKKDTTTDGGLSGMPIKWQHMPPLKGDLLVSEISDTDSRPSTSGVKPRDMEENEDLPNQAAALVKKDDIIGTADNGNSLPASAIGTGGSSSQTKQGIPALQGNIFTLRDHASKQNQAGNFASPTVGLSGLSTQVATPAISSRRAAGNSQKTISTPTSSKLWTRDSDSSATDSPSKCSSRWRSEPVAAIMHQAYDGRESSALASRRRRATEPRQKEMMYRSGCLPLPSIQDDEETLDTTSTMPPLRVAETLERVRSSSKDSCEGSDLNHLGAQATQHRKIPEVSVENLKSVKDGIQAFCKNAASAASNAAAHRAIGPARWLSGYKESQAPSPKVTCFTDGADSQQNTIIPAAMNNDTSRPLNEKPSSKEDDAAKMESAVSMQQVLKAGSSTERQKHIPNVVQHSGESGSKTAYQTRNPNENSAYPQLAYNSESKVAAANESVENPPEPRNRQLALKQLLETLAPQR